MQNGLQRLFDSGDSKQLEAEVQRIALLSKSVDDQNDLNKMDVERGMGKWRDRLLNICGLALGFNLLGVPTLNVVSVWVNGIWGTSVSVIPPPDSTIIVTILVNFGGAAVASLVATRDKYVG